QDEEHASIGSAVDPGAPFSRQADLRARIHSRRDLDLLSHGLAFQAGGTAVFTGRGNDLAPAVTGRAGAGLHHLPQERLADLAHLALSATGGTAQWRGARFCA